MPYTSTLSPGSLPPSLSRRSIGDKSSTTPDGIALGRSGSKEDSGVDFLTTNVQTLNNKQQSSESESSALSIALESDSTASSDTASPSSSASINDHIMDHEIQKQDLDQTSHLFEIRDANDKGLGAFTTSKILRGTTILLEKPLLRVIGDYLPSDIEREFQNLSPSSQEDFMTLASVHGIKDLKDRIRVIERSSGANPLFEDSRQISMLKARSAGERSILSTFYSNAISTKDGGAIFLEASRINHSCIPNASYHWAPHLEMVQIRATKDIDEGQEITISYLDPCQLAHTRQRWLRDNYGFSCDCPACEDTYDPRSFASRSHDRRLKLQEYREYGYQFEGSLVEMRKLPSVIQAFQDEELCIPQLGKACMRLGKLYGGIKGLEKQQVEKLQLAVDTFLTSQGEEFEDTKEASKALEVAKAKIYRSNQILDGLLQ